ncbi:MAG TPA: aminoglycoside phosphotransferase family protein [Gemmata sp.]|nr:aminoglycoside phosphotransferase family protein [Gemmata sp.]
MSTPNLAAVNRLTEDAGFGPVDELIPLAGGANNRVYRVVAGCGDAVLKCYFRHPDDPRDRLGAEFAFTRFAWAAGVRDVTEPLACDPANAIALYAFVNGARPTASDVTEELVGQATEFVRELNAARWRPRAARLPLASEACFSIAEHLGTVARRVERLAQAKDPAASEFVRQELVPAWQEVHAACERDARKCGLPLERALGEGSRCLSPSDFGFHNVVLQPSGRARFIDFEYAGWDDPAKLICDFFCQPAVPVPARHFESFTAAVATGFPEPDAVAARARLLLPVYRLKWVCIRLNEFLPVGTRRREFALPPAKLEYRRRRQLADARAALQHAERVAA